MTQINALIDVATAQIGTAEDPRGSNNFVWRKLSSAVEKTVRRN